MSEQENLNFEHKYILDWLKENTQVIIKEIIALSFDCFYRVIQ